VAKVTKKRQPAGSGDVKDSNKSTPAPWLWRASGCSAFRFLLVATRPVWSNHRRPSDTGKAL